MACELSHRSVAMASSGMPALPAGFRFHPTDEELIVHYLMNQAAAAACPVPIIAEVNIYKCNPWDLPAKALFGENEWYFFSPRDRKYPNGARPNRAAGSGYWKATGTDKAILSTATPASEHMHIGVKKALVFYRGKPPKGDKTDWIMHEYRLSTPATTTRRRPPAAASSMRLDDWVLCRIYKKSNDFNLLAGDEPEQEEGSTVDDHSLNGGAATEVSPSSESEAAAAADHDEQQQQQLPALAITKSCSLTDLLGSIDYSTLSQLLLDVVPSDDAADEQIPTPPIYSTPPCQTLNFNNQTNTDQISITRVDSGSGSGSDYSSNIPPNYNCLKRRRVITGSAASARSLDDHDGTNPTKKSMMVTSDSRMTSSYCNQQIADGSSFQFQHSSLLSYPFLINQQLILNNHLQMQ